jgi:hypothetical protein
MCLQFEACFLFGIITLLYPTACLKYMQKEPWCRLTRLFCRSKMATAKTLLTLQSFMVRSLSGCGLVVTRTIYIQEVNCLKCMRKICYPYLDFVR